MKLEGKFSILHRVLHWTMAGSMLILYNTGFLRMYWMGKEAVVKTLENQGILVTKEQAKAVYTNLREPMWQWHEIFAKVMVLAILVRIIYMFWKDIRFPNPFKSGISTKEKLQGFVYLYFYFFVLVNGFTGICMEEGYFKSVHETMETIHKWGIYWFPIFILLHFVGIWMAEKYQNKGISSKMIGGEN
jgi:cytochrome b561